ncbi:hypothetical protein AAVH_41378, partial [Aphelenchoides avenae]
KVFHGGEAANAKKRKQDDNAFEQRKEDRANGVEWLFKPRRRNSDGPPSKAVRVFYLRESATDKELRQRGAGSAAKKALEHTHPDIVLCLNLRATYHKKNAATGLKIDFVSEEVTQPPKMCTLSKTT